VNRFVPVVVVALCLNPSLVRAQSTQFTVNTVSADVHKSPSTGSPVIGSAPRGTVLEVTRELGSWVKISWPRAEEGVGYLHVSMGFLTKRLTEDPNRDAGLRSPRPTPGSAPPTTVARVQPAGQPATSQVGSTRAVYVAPPAHIVGLGGLISGSNLGYGASARQWSRGRVGFQIDLSHNALTSAAQPGRVTAVQLAPSVLCSLGDHITDFVWVRPYLGAGAGLLHETFSSTPGVGDTVSDNSLGVHAFGGGEFTFPSVPRFAVSADLGYRWLRTPFAGFELGGLNVSVSGHWYIK
jgi:Bacterial SH3 domain